MTIFNELIFLLLAYSEKSFFKNQQGSGEAYNK